DPFAPTAACVLSPNATADEVVGFLNANTAKISAWRSDNVTIAGRGAAASPVKLSANLAIEAPRNFRLVAKPPVGGAEVDLGSNQDQFWFWNKRSEEKYVFVAYHDEESVRKRPLPIPFQPNWI